MDNIQIEKQRLRGIRTWGWPSLLSDVILGRVSLGPSDGSKFFSANSSKSSRSIPGLQYTSNIELAVAYPVISRHIGMFSAA